MTRTKMAKSSNHWYDVSGSEIVSAHDADLRQARKRNLFISPTSLMKIRANPMLQRWLTKETVKACDENPRYANEDMDFYVRRIDELAGKIASNAADRGTAIHAILEEYPKPCADASLVPWWDCFDAFYKDNFQQTLHNEIRLCDRDIGVAGTCDLIAVHKEHGLCIADYKTKRKMTGDIWFDSYKHQLSFYCHAYAKANGLSELPACISIAIDSTEPNTPLMKVWPRAEIESGYKEFLCMAFMWFNERNYWPVQKWELNYTK